MAAVTPYPINYRYSYPSLKSKTFDDGIRLYETPSGVWVPSVTTILSTLPKDGLIAWRERVGDEEADRITEEACDIGSQLHDMLEGYVSGYLKGKPQKSPETQREKIAWGMAKVVQDYGLLDCLDEVWAIEEALYFDEFYAGRTDLIGKYQGNGDDPRLQVVASPEAS